MAPGVSNVDVGSHKFPTYSPGVAMLLDFVIVYNGSELRSGGEICSLRAINDSMYMASLHVIYVEHSALPA